ncbi:hypothetical protein [Microcoleus sp.]|uniref:hypothetical protein n=1 Tax=Microcoleus sp. TaxID=44472 RepID=UPI003593B55B
MKVEDILQTLEEIRDKLNAVRDSPTYQALIEYPEYIIEDVTLADSVQGVYEALEMIPYISELSKDE